MQFSQVEWSKIVVKGVVVHVFVDSEMDCLVVVFGDLVERAKIESIGYYLCDMAKTENYTIINAQQKTYGLPVVNVMLCN